MKYSISCIAAILIYCSCKQTSEKPVYIRDGFYQVIKLSEDPIPADSLKPGQVVIPFDTLFNPGDYTKVAIDTSDYVALELETAPVTSQETGNKKLLSITLTPAAAEKNKTFTAQRVMQQVVIVLDGKAITSHKIREAITGPEMQITRCGDNACEYLYVKMKDKVKR